MAKIVRSHGKYHSMFPMTFYCKFCGCVFDCEYISDADIYEFYSEVFAQALCPECEKFVKNNIGLTEPEIEVNEHE